jgi:hypothetical protein
MLLSEVFSRLRVGRGGTREDKSSREARGAALGARAVLSS